MTQLVPFVNRRMGSSLMKVCVFLQEIDHSHAASGVLDSVPP
jgi:hypothetical protein